MNKNNFCKAILSLLFLVTPFGVFSQDFPAKPVPPRLVNDFSGTLTSNETEALEQKLVSFNDSTSTQIAIVMVPDLKGYDVTDYAVRLGNNWGIGQKGKNNGILIVIKPKTATSGGEAAIVTGYGAEGPVPDLICSDIINNEMIPSFKLNDYYGGLESATTVLMSLIRGEYTADQYKAGSGSGNSSLAPFIVLIILFIFIVFGSSGRNRHNSISRSGNLPLWILLGMMNSGSRSHSGSWGGFTSGGGGGGGFGGFGGGSFGGGGASGSW